MTGTAATATLSGRRRERDSSGAGRGGPLFRFPRAPRKAVVTVHVAASVGWLGVHLTLIVLTTNAALADTPERAAAGYAAAALLVTTLIAPLSLIAGGSGLLLSLGTSWGLLRYYWVAIKLVLTVALVVGSNLVLGPQVVELAPATAGTEALPAAGERARIVTALSVAWSLLLAATVLSTVKPFGRLPRRPNRPAAPAATRTPM